MAKNVLVVADIKNGKLRNVSFEMMGGARKMAGDGEVSVAIIGAGVSGLAEGLGEKGADKVFVIDDEALQTYTPSAYRKAVMEVYRAANPDVVLFAHSAIGRDVAPMLAMRLGVGQASDVVDFDLAGDNVTFTRPIYAGKAYTKVQLTKNPVIATVRPNNWAPLEEGVGKAGAVDTLTVTFGEQDLTTMVQEIVQKTAAGVDLTEAKIIISGGRGVKSAEGFKPLQELADVLGAAVGASRGACDAEYCDYSLQIGQTGKVVTPDLYIACGISGAIQHLAGMSNSKVIVAVNKDPEAPIFQVADYGIVGDLFEVVPLMTKALKEAMA